MNAQDITTMTDSDNPPAPAPARHTWLALRISERKLLLAMVDLLIINGALLLRVMVETGFSQPAHEVGGWWLWFLVLSALWLVIAILFDLYDLARAASAMDSLWATGGAALLVSLSYLLIPRLTPGLPQRRLVLFLFPLLATLGLVAWRVTYAKVFVQVTFYRPLLVVGAGGAGRTLAQAVAEKSGDAGNPYRGTGYQILGFIDDDPGKLGQEIEGVPVLGNRGDLVRLALALHPCQVVVAITDLRAIHAHLYRDILACSELGVPLTTMPDLFERITGRLPVEHVGRNLHAVLPLDRPALYKLYLGARRLVEIVFAAAGCLLTLLVVPFLWLADRVACPGDLFYTQERVGQGGRVFRIAKFRSMVMDAERHSGAVWARQGDDRVTAVGRFLRRTRLDEIPQFWNVLKGDMHIIGPRPERPEFLEQLSAQVPYYRLRQMVKPGLTGWAQVMYRYAASVEDAEVKLEHDLYYIKHEGLYLDLLILIRTIRTVLRMQGH